jgi:hypothetical protein
MEQGPGGGQTHPPARGWQRARRREQRASWGFPSVAISISARRQMPSLSPPQAGAVNIGAGRTRPLTRQFHERQPQALENFRRPSPADPIGVSPDKVGPAGGYFAKLREISALIRDAADNQDDPDDHDEGDQPHDNERDPSLHGIAVDPGIVSRIVPAARAHARQLVVRRGGAGSHLAAQTPRRGPRRAGQATNAIARRKTVIFREQFTNPGR